VLGGRNGVGDEVLDVVAPQVLAVEELLAGGCAVDRGDRLRDRDRVLVELLGDGREVLAADDATLRRLDRKDRVLAEELVQRDPQLQGLRGCLPARRGRHLHAGHRPVPVVPRRGERPGCCGCDGQGEHREQRERRFQILQESLRWIG